MMGLFARKNFSWPYSETATSRISLQIGSVANFSNLLVNCKIWVLGAMLQFTSVYMADLSWIKLCMMIWFQLKEMVLALLIESDLTLTEDVVETIVDKTFNDADSKGDGRTNVHQMAARASSHKDSGGLEEDIKVDSVGLQQLGSVEQEAEKVKDLLVLDLFDVLRNVVIESGEFIRSLGIFHPTFYWRRKLH
ncbi:hypothetical protein IFM89_028492 [Coptis chinensis]|uniref:Calcineurin B-like protein n=1 Tax=Coptis chinensis TaxID=261450 RepID=A0A835HQQ0_9MAGN|nr:hypothetical protein IFM89_028492 [Coptis chinensis]